MIPGVSQFGGYVKGIAQNVRDVGTAFGTNAKIGLSGGLKSTAESNPLNQRAQSNLVTQVKEVGGAFLGKPGTRSDQYSPSTGYVSGSKLKK
jgi:hypothetical protein